ncbi:Gfo/Idh/MocA family oxidoreductase [Bacillaceae bacterium SIJ1]|uniref:Gfo/Idh/MocA family protein n=1 Tax=Litoribacterium kuwaitense TaxID=1398745 RepID=UPI0013EA465E|nr:Gfo/Idh/MocA family oxidoreductase [Litoribacterium kuwaitense]NGP44369.1 Gfo/Idh/MocA family oxidoreductase [Litoribacterium kuwaitense]
MKVAIVGAGTMGKVHADAYTKMEGVTLAGIVDTDEKQRETASVFQVPLYASFEEMLEKEAPDVIDVCVPTDRHAEYVKKAAEAKKHVICEKPIARTVQEAEEMIATCEKAGVQLFIGQVVRFFPEFSQAKQLVENGKIGTPGTARLKRAGTFPRAHENWYADDARSGSVFLDLCIHDIDYVCWLFGDVARVYAKGFKNDEGSAYVHGVISLRFANGVIGHIEGSWAYAEGFMTEFELAGTKGIVRHKSTDAMPLEQSFKASEENASQTNVQVPASPTEKNPYEIELRHFMDCLQHGTEPIVTPQDALIALKVGLAARESIETNQVVTLGGGTA